jgi:hypothetical protein
MTTYQSPRRIVVWTDGTAAAAHATGWAAAHAAARALPLHVVHLADARILAEAGRPGSAGADFAARHQTALDLAELAQEMHCIHDLVPALPVTAEVAEDDARHPGSPPPTAPGDLLVTGTSGLGPLTADGDGKPKDPPVPLVVVPDTPQGERDCSKCTMLLLSGPRLSPAAAAFAFHTAADLGATLDVVRLAPQGGAFGDDYWIEPGHPEYRAEPRMQHELSKLRADFPTVPGRCLILRTRPLSTLRTMARSAHLAVLGGGPDVGRNLRAMLELAACPIAVVPGA